MPKLEASTDVCKSDLLVKSEKAGRLAGKSDFKFSKVSQIHKQGPKVGHSRGDCVGLEMLDALLRNCGFRLQFECRRGSLVSQVSKGRKIPWINVLPDRRRIEF